jgi:hypothetical protein
MASILITGGSGLIGQHLSKKLLEKGHTVAILSRQTSEMNLVYKWDLATNFIEENAIKNCDYIIHLAGAGIADMRWTEQRKKVLVNSRVDSAQLLFNKVKTLNPTIKGFISASGIGYYGAKTTHKVYDENSPAGNDFLAEICKKWEKAALNFKTINIRTVIFRTGIVLTPKGGALEKIAFPIKYGLGAALGSGKQYMPWIHINDLCNLYIAAIEHDNYNGIYNAVAPEHCTNKSFSASIATILKKPFFLPNIPSFVLKLIMGEVACILLEGSKIASTKIINNGFKFQFNKLNAALEHLLKN